MWARATKKRLSKKKWLAKFLSINKREKCQNFNVKFACWDMAKHTGRDIEKVNRIRLQFNFHERTQVKEQLTLLQDQLQSQAQLLQSARTKRTTLAAVGVGTRKQKDTVAIRTKKQNKKFRSQFTMMQRQMAYNLVTNSCSSRATGAVTTTNTINVNKYQRLQPNTILIY